MRFEASLQKIENSKNNGTSEQSNVSSTKSWYFATYIHSNKRAQQPMLKRNELASVEDTK